MAQCDKHHASAPFGTVLWGQVQDEMSGFMAKLIRNAKRASPLDMTLSLAFIAVPVALPIMACRFLNADPWMPLTVGFVAIVVGLYYFAHREDEFLVALISGGLAALTSLAILVAQRITGT
jgi:hypothetical protein